MPESPWRRVARPLDASRGKWHLLLVSNSRTICDRRVWEWEEQDRYAVDAREICAICLRQTA